MEVCLCFLLATARRSPSDCPKPRAELHPLDSFNSLLGYIATLIHDMLTWCLISIAQSSLPPPPPPAPPVVPYGSRHMRPPSSPQYGPTPREPPLQSPISRDLPALPTNPRPTSSMSISSLLGTDPGRPSRDPPLSVHPNTSQPSGSFSSLSHYATSNSSPSKPPNGSGPEYQGSPPAQNAMSGILNRPFRAYSGGSSGVGKPTSPSASILRFDPLSTTGPSSIPQNSPRSAGVQDRIYDTNRNIGLGRAIERPNSQPIGFHKSPIDFDQRARELDARRAELARQEEEIIRNGTGFADRARSSKYDTPGRQRHEGSGSGMHSIPQKSPRNGRAQSSGYSILSNPSALPEANTKSSKGEYTYTPKDRVINDDQEPQQFSQKSPYDADALRRLRDERLGATIIQQQQEPNPVSLNARPRFLDNLENRQDQIENRRLSTVSSATAMERTRSVDSVGRGSEDLNNHRHSLAIMLDNNKRGRLSPLPQAVQGAQSRPSNTPSRDPGIKNEFSKMFAGIGSGVTGVGGSGASTPFPPSPRQSVENEQRPFGPPGEIIKITESRNGSRMGKRKPKAKDDEIDNNDGRAFGASVDGRGMKRAKHGHRHHIHGHQYVGSFRRFKSKLTVPSHHRDEGTPLRNISNPNGSTPVPHHNHHLHHHHHADGTIHHHHHNHTRQPATPAEKTPPPPRIPKTVIDNTAVLSAVSPRPRHHLGSTVYAPTSTTSNPKLDDMCGTFAISPQHGQENCTLTVRVPRFYLTHSNLLRTTARQAVWGTDVYTDDSDPLCAAIHDGWIRGAWPDNIDANLLEPELKNVSLADSKSTTKDKVLETPPLSGPMLVPKGRDMQITVIILPALQYYASRVAHGVKSRIWGANHEGLSFKIEKIAFVDGGQGKAEQKIAMVRKERIAASIRSDTLMKLSTDPIHLRMPKTLVRPRKPAVKPAIKAVKEIVAAA